MCCHRLPEGPALESQREKERGSLAAAAPQLLHRGPCTLSLKMVPNPSQESLTTSHGLLRNGLTSRWPLPFRVRRDNATLRFPREGRRIETRLNKTPMIAAHNALGLTPALSFAHFRLPAGALRGGRTSERVHCVRRCPQSRAGARNQGKPNAPRFLWGALVRGYGELS